jgi:hypothetical protein
MNRFRALAAGLLMSAAMVVFAPVQAMEIRQFDKMDDRDQGAYVGLLVQGAEKVLTDEGRTDLAAQINKLFLTRLGNDKMTLGMIEFERNLALTRLDDAKDHETKPNDPWLDVEDVMFLTLQKNHIDLPDSFFTVNRGFRPKYPPQH